MWREIDRRSRFRLGATFVLTAMLAVLAHGNAEARKQVAGPPLVVPRLDQALIGVPLDPNWQKHVYVVTDSVVLGAKQQFINSLPDWQVTFTGRPALMIRKGLDEYVRRQHNTGPVAVVALGYNTLWEKDRRNFKKWSGLFDKSVEEMLAALKERGARKIVWVMLRELTPDMITTGGVSLSQYHRYAWYFPYVNERLRAIKERHPEMALADWAAAAHVTGVTYDAIHLNPRGADLMVKVVKTAMGVYGGPSRLAAPQPPAPATSALMIAEPPRRVVAEQPRQKLAQPRVEQPRDEETRPRKKPSYRGHRQEMFALSRFESTPVVMLGDSLTERAQWSEITGCRFIANRGIGGDDSSGVLRRIDAVTKLRPAAVFLMIGVNDVVSNVPVEQIVDNVKQTIDRLMQSGAKVYLALVLPVTQSFPRRINAQVGELNAAYVKLAGETRATLVDLRAGMETGAGFLRDELSTDGLHLSPFGYRVWRDAVAPLVSQHCSPAAIAVALVKPAKAAMPPVLAPVVPNIADVTASIPARPGTHGTWIIQVGAFPEKEKARERIREAQILGKNLVANANPFTEKIMKGGLELYRVRFAGFDQSAAEAACGYFKRNAMDCISLKK